MNRLGVIAVVLGCVMWVYSGSAISPGHAQPEAAPESQLPHPSELWPIPEDNGYDDFLAAIELLPDIGESPSPDEEPPIDIYTILGEGPEGFTNAEMEQAFQSCQPALDKLREALDKPFVVPYQWIFESRPWEHDYHQELSKARYFCMILSVQAAYHQRLGEDEKALDSLQLALRLGDSMSHGGLLIHRLVNISIRAIGLSAWRDWIRSRPPADTLHEAGQFLQELEQRQVRVWKIIVMEAWLYRQTIEDLYAGRLSSEEWAEWTQGRPELKELPQGGKTEVLQEWERYFTELVELSKLPLHQLIGQEPPRVEIESLKPLTYPRFPRFVEKEARIQTDLRGVRIIVALEYYRSQQPHQGRYPPQLSDLVPKYLVELPKDPFTDEDFIYRREDNLVYKLYSVGPNKIDDGGVQEHKYWLPGDPDIVIVGAE